MEMIIHVLDKKTEQIVATLENKNGYPALFWDDRHIEKIEKGFNTYEFVTIDNEKNPAAEFLVNKNKIVIRDLDGFHIPFIIEEVEQDSRHRIKRVYAEGEHMELRTAKIIEPKTLTGATINTAADFILSGTRWQRGITEFTGSRTINFKGYTSALSALHQIRSEFGVELRFRVEISGNQIVARYVDFLVPDDVFNGKEIVFGKDLVGIRRIENTGELYTILYGVGQADAEGKFVTFESINNGKKYLEDAEAIQRWGELRGVYEVQSENGEALTPQIVKDKTAEALENFVQSAVKYEVDAVVLERILGLEHEKVRKGMMVRIKDEKFNPPLYLEARVLETERSYTAKDRDQFVLGNYREVQVVKDPAIAKIQSILFRNENAWSSSARVIRSETPPEDTHAIWIDITKDPEVPMTYDFTANEWKKASPTVAEEIGAETPTGAQQKAQEAETNAKQYADAQDVTVYADATYYADQVANTAEQNAKQYAEQYAQQYAEPKTPDVIPSVPTNFTATGAFKKVILKWDVDTSKTISHYELYGSQTQGFTPDSTNLLWKGKESTFIHEANVNQTWYYRLRVVNVYGKAGAFTTEVSATTAKIVSDDILFGAINAQHLADLSVTAAKLADGSITTPKIADGAVNTAKIVDDAITQAKIAAGAVGNAELDRSTANKIQIGSNDIINGAITNLKIASNAVDSSKLADLAVTAAKLATGAVDNTKLDRTSPNKIQIETADIKDAAITSAKIANAAIGAAAIATAAIGTAHIADGAITNAKIADATIDSAKINKIYADKIAVADFTNLVKWDIENNPNGTVVVINNTKYYKVGPNAYAPLKFSTSPKVEFKVGDEYYFALYGYKDAAIASITFIIRYFYTDGTWSNAGTASAPFTTTEGLVSGVCKITSAPTSGKTISRVDFFIEKNNETTGYYYARDLELRKRQQGELIVDGAITASKIAAGAITAGSAIIADGAITSAKIADAAITSVKIANAAIGNAAIQNGAITNAKIANAAVGTAQIADAAITNAKIANLAVDDAKIANLHGSKIIADSITADKLNVSTLSAISADLGTVTAGVINGVTINGSTITSAKPSGNLTISGGDVTSVYNFTVAGENYRYTTKITDGKITIQEEKQDPTTGAWVDYGILTIEPNNISNSTGTVFFDSNIDISGTIINEARINASLMNGWLNYMGGYHYASYWKDKNGVVHITGVIKNGSVGYAAFTLPAGYRPTGREIFRCICAGDQTARIDVDTNGNVIIMSCPNTGWLSLAGISFKAEA
jgi:phage minor structural protein